MLILRNYLYRIYVVLMPAKQTPVRSVAVEDLDKIAEIFAQYVTNGIITFEEVPSAVVGRRSELRGCRVRLCASPWRDKPAYRDTVEDTMYLAPEWTGKGLGRLLLDRLVAECTQPGVRQVIAVIADTSGLTSAALHYGCGFIDARRLEAVGYMHGRWVNTLLLQRDLDTMGPYR